MRLIYLKLWNIRSYVNEKIDFPEGRVLLSGDIGAGKSTILLAIEFALFGIKRGDFSGLSVLRNGTNEGLVELKFFVAPDKEVIVQRRLKRSQKSVKQESGFIVLNKQKFEGTPVELKSKILEILGYPSSLISKNKDMVYRYTVYTPQADMNRILFSDNEERLDTLRRVFNIDRYKRVRENLQVIVRNMKSKISNLEGKIDDLPEKARERKNLVSEINEIIRYVKSILPKIAEVNSNIESINSQIKDADAKNALYIQEKENYEHLVKEKSNLKESITKLENHISKIHKDISKIKDKLDEIDVSDKSIEQFKDNIAAKRKELEDSKEKNSVLNQKISYTKDEIKKLEDETHSKKRLDKEISAKKQQIKSFEVALKQKSYLEKDIEKIEKILQKLNNNLAEHGVNYANAKKIIDDVSNLSDCPTCHQEVTEEYKKKMIKQQKDLLKDIDTKKKEIEASIEGYENRMKKSKENLKILFEKESELEKSRLELNNLETTMKEFDVKRSRLEELKSKLERITTDFIHKEVILSLSNELIALEKSYEKIKDNISKLREIKYMEKNLENYEFELKSAKEKLSLIESNIESSAKKLDSMKNIKEDLDKLKKVSEQEREREKELMMEKTSFLSKRDSMMKTKESLDKEIIEKRLIKDKLDKLLELKSWLLDYFSKITLSMERSIMSRIFWEFDELFRQWFNIMIEDELISVRLDEEFTPIIEQNGHEMSIDDLSGGEKTSCALAYRLALNKVINDCIDSIKTRDLIILDEPTDGFSSEQLDRLRDVLGKLNISQVIIVSHEAKIESYVDNVLRIAKVEHVSSLV